MYGDSYSQLSLATEQPLQCLLVASLVAIHGSTQIISAVIFQLKLMRITVQCKVHYNNYTKNENCEKSENGHRRRRRGKRRKHLHGVYE